MTPLDRISNIECFRANFTFLPSLFSFARAFEMHTVLYTVLYPYFIYPMTNIMLSASIFFTVVLGLER